ncbi:site-2 protease family protein [Kordia sp. YSTF-M3]|uniref:Site-2 protease family protein n=1 Tax=Kordia aestuariivivens TaxID=2759037 RepID=A0ABR7Q9K2_9FLAO|nr:site-2 protease family protein [Kordia aestuariivivens]MBC8755223.1 site-2 protease family protein [Kordia aestuariivivens]
MDLLTIPVYFGIAAVIIMFLFNIFHYSFASIFGVRVETFGMFITIGNTYFLKFKRNHTDYTLGWIPTTGFVKISGMFDDNIDGEPVKEEDYMLSSKTPFVRFICTVGAPLLLLIPFVVSAMFIDPNGSLNANFNVLNDVIYNLYQLVIGTIESVEAHENWNAIANTYAVFPIILCIMSLFTAFVSITTLLTNSIGQKIEAFNVIGSIGLLILYLYILYKIGSLYFSVHNFTDALFSFVQFIITTYIISFVLMLLIKILPKNKYI